METPAIDLVQEAREEEHLAHSLNKLHELYIQLRKLRDTVPSLIRPMRTSAASPELVYAEFAKAATNAVNNTRDFASVMKTKSTQDVLLEARKSRSENPDGIMAWLAAQHENWMDKPLPINTKKESDVDIQELEGSADLSIVEAVDMFLKTHPDANVESPVETQRITYTLPSAGIVFQIEANDDGTGRKDYTVTCQAVSSSKTLSELHPSITQALSRRSRQFDLVYTLRLLSSYSDLYSRKCSKCERLVDSFGQFPIARQQGSGEQSDQFQALHEACLPE